MILDADQYRVNVLAIQGLLADKTEKERLDFIGVLAIATGVPIIIVACYLGELYGFSEELERQLSVFKKFYAVEEVKNVRKVTE